MNNANYYCTLFLVLFTTVFSFFHMFYIIHITNDVIHMMIYHLIPSLVPFMLLVSLCISLGLFHFLSYFLQFILSPLFHLTPIMSALFMMSFFCGYPSNVRMYKEAYINKQISLRELQHLLTIGTFASISFIFASLGLPFLHAGIIYFSHIVPNIVCALFYNETCKKIYFKDISTYIRFDRYTFINSLKKSIHLSCITFIYIAGYILVFRVIAYSLYPFISHPFIYIIIKGMLEFSLGCFDILKYNHVLTYPLISFFLSFSSVSVLMQIDNILEDIPYSFFQLIISRFIQGIFSFLICWLVIMIYL